MSCKHYCKHAQHGQAKFKAIEWSLFGFVGGRVVKKNGAPQTPQTGVTLSGEIWRANALPEPRYGANVAES